MCRITRISAILLTAALLALPGPVRAQAGSGGAGAAAGRAVGPEALDLFERVCLGALARGEDRQAVAARELAGAAPVPQERLRSNLPVREIAGWRVQDRHTVMLLEPGAQCAVYTAGVEPDAFLADARALMQRADALPGWVRQGEPQASDSPRPFGTLSFLRARFVRPLPLPDVRPGGGGVPLPAADILASAARRTDGQPNTAVISAALDQERRP